MKTVWIAPTSDEVLTTGVERGLGPFLFQTRKAIEDRKGLAQFEGLYRAGDEVLDEAGVKQARWMEITSGAEQDEGRALAGDEDLVVMSARDWQIIPAENLIAGFHLTMTSLLAHVTTAAEARTMFESLELGTDGVVLETADPKEVVDLVAYLESLAARPIHPLVVGTITRLESVGMGDRVCVDTTSLMEPGEGLLVGSSSQGLFLVHAESLKSEYVASRPFRVNAGPVHAYTAVPDGKTQYLSELGSGSEVIVVDHQGHSRVATVGRVKIEKRPFLLVEVQVGNQVFSHMVQNAETVRLVVPAGEDEEEEGPFAETRAVSVVDLTLGDEVLVASEAGGRHFGMKVEESIVEK